MYASGGAFCLAALNQALRGIRPEQFGPITAPTKILWSDADRTHRQTDKDSCRVWRKDLEVIHWPDVGHCPELERPEHWLRLLD